MFPLFTLTYLVLYSAAAAAAAADDDDDDDDDNDDDDDDVSIAEFKQINTG